ncbi:MAG: hypothetical protein ACRD8K_04620 [Nitrososphaeraceae archaeon]|jgi:hypothetical protein
MTSANIQNANILYDFIITEHNYTNVRLSTRLSGSILSNSYN